MGNNLGMIKNFAVIVAGLNLGLTGVAFGDVREYEDKIQVHRLGGDDALIEPIDAIKKYCLGGAKEALLIKNSTFDMHTQAEHWTEERNIFEGNLGNIYRVIKHTEYWYGNEDSEQTTIYIDVQCID